MFIIWFIITHVLLEMRKWMGILLAAPKLPLPPWASPFPHLVRFWIYSKRQKRLLLWFWSFFWSVFTARTVIGHNTGHFIYIPALTGLYMQCTRNWLNVWCLVRADRVRLVKVCRIQFCHNKMCIFHHNPTRSWVIVAQSGESIKNGYWSVLFSSYEFITFWCLTALNTWLS